jgi:transcriptional regulator with XRE-family HTH domain
MDEGRVIGQRVKRAREDKGWTQGQLSARMGLFDSSYVSKLEAGKIRRPTFSRLAQIARALGVPDYELTGGAPPPGSADSRLVTAAAEVSTPEQVERILDRFEALPPEYKRLALEHIDHLYESTERTRAERRAELQRQRRAMQEPEKPPDPEPDPPEAPGVGGGVLAAAVG